MKGCEKQATALLRYTYTFGGPNKHSWPSRFQMKLCALRSAQKQPRMNRPKLETSAKWNPKKCSDQARCKAETY